MRRSIIIRLFYYYTSYCIIIDGLIMCVVMCYGLQRKSRAMVAVVFFVNVCFLAVILYRSVIQVYI